MTNNFRVHLSVLLLGVLMSVIFLICGLIERGELLYLTAVLFIFGETVLATKKFYDWLGNRRNTPS